MLTKAERDAFNCDGYLVVQDAIDVNSLEAFKHDLNAFCQGTAEQLARDGRIRTACASSVFSSNFCTYVSNEPELLNAIESRDFNRIEGLYQLMNNDRLLSIVGSIVGQDILCHPVYNLHARLPGHRTVAHQDAAYFLPESDGTLIVACIVPLLDSTLERGCLWVSPGHHLGGIMPHTQTWVGDSICLTISDEELPWSTRKPIPTPFGSVVLLGSMLPHGSLPNASNLVRWSLDLRYQSAGFPTGRWYEVGFEAVPSSQLPSGLPGYHNWLKANASAHEEALAHPNRPMYRWNDIHPNITNVGRG